ncbi:RICIN domain-containing protein [Amycolatopsis sp. cg5]|uniref:RICIN domain-containing protein n=1 Tax=Amycolatopsis sp. cg5 TaxID=3238802 RepID=UPI0035253FA3
MRSAVVAGAAAATLAGLAPAPAVAATAAETPSTATKNWEPVGVPATGTAARAAAAQSTDDEKIAAAALLGVNPGPELMILTDRDFTVAMYRIADDQDKPRPLEPGNRTVKAAALKALEEGDAACLTFIKTGMKVAHDEDVRLDLEWRDQQNKERDAKALAGQLLRIPVGNAEKAMSLYDFIAYLDLNADAHKDQLVKEKAQLALGGTPDEQWTFLSSGLGIAHTADVQRLIREKADQTQAEKDAALAREAKANAAWHALGIVAPDNMTRLSDQSFVFEISNRASQDTEVFGAAEEALASHDPVQWKRFIDTGAQEAHERDIENTLRKRDETRTRQIFELRTRAANSLAHPALVAAADKALAGTTGDRIRFLLTGKDENLTQTLRTVALDDFYLADGNGQTLLTPWATGQHPEQVWKVEPGLADPTCHSFASTTRPNHYLRYINNRLSVDPADGTNAFGPTVTWCARRSGSGIAFTHVLSKVDLAVNAPSGGTVWSVEAPKPPMPIERRYNTDASARGKLGAPTADAVLGGNGVGYRKYQNGRLYQAFRPGATNLTTSVVTGEVLAKFSSLGYETGVLGYPVEDERAFSKGRVQRFTGGAVYVVSGVGTFVVYGETYQKYAATGSENGLLSYPTSDTVPLSDGIGWYTTFFGNTGAIYYTQATGAKLVYGSIRGKYNEIGAEKSWLGYPTSDEFDLPKGRRNTFQSGRIDFSNDGGATVAYKTAAVAPKAIELKGVESGRCIQVAGLGQDAIRDGAGIELWDCVAGVKQIWDVVALGNDKYNLKNRNSGKCLDVYNSTLDNQGGIIQHTCHGGLNQQWEFTTDNTGANYALRAAHSAKVLDAKGHGTANATLLQQFADKAEGNQRWTIIPQ